VRLAGNVTLWRLVQLVNASAPIVVTPSGNTISLRLVQLMNALGPIVASELLAGNVRVLRLKQLVNALEPIVARAEGSTALSRSYAPKNRLEPIVVTVLGMVAFVGGGPLIELSTPPTTGNLSTYSCLTIISDVTWVVDDNVWLVAAFIREPSVSPAAGAAATACLGITPPVGT
jgi:hypothetical protein